MARTATKAEPKPVFYFPEGRLINHALFERDAFMKADGKGQPGAPKYKAEVAYDPATVVGEGTIEDKMADFFASKFGDAAADRWLNAEAGHIRPFLSGDRLAAKREEKGKEGDAYKGKLIIRADTTFNKDGRPDEGGATVVDHNGEPILFANKDLIYPGCYGILAVTFDSYTDYPQDGNKGMKCYLVGFQKSRDGEKLSSGGDGGVARAGFKPLGNTPAAGRTRNRAG